MTEKISASFPFESHYVEVHGSRMHYVDEGTGDPILFLHGNPTSSYLWRNVIPHLKQHGRAIALDLIGMGKSEKPDLDYRFVDHAKYVEGFINALKLASITLVIHDWGSGLGFDYAMRHPERIKGIAFLEAITRTMSWKDANLMERLIFKRFRHPKKGPKMIMKNNFFVEKLMPKAIVRKLSDEEKAHYREPFLEEKDRKPVWVWPNEIPFDGQPADTHSIIQSYHEKLKSSPIPKLLLWAEPGMIIKGKKAAEKIKNTFANTETYFIGKGKHYLQEDHPHVIGKAIANWYTQISQKVHSTS